MQCECETDSAVCMVNVSSMQNTTSCKLFPPHNRNISGILLSFPTANHLPIQFTGRWTKLHDPTPAYYTRARVLSVSWPCPIIPAFFDDNSLNSFSFWDHKLLFGAFPGFMVLREYSIGYAYIHRENSKTSSGTYCMSIGLHMFLEHITTSVICCWPHTRCAELFHRTTFTQILLSETLSFLLLFGCVPASPQDPPFPAAPSFCASDSASVDQCARLQIIFIAYYLLTVMYVVSQNAGRQAAGEAATQHLLRGRKCQRLISARESTARLRQTSETKLQR